MYKLIYSSQAKKDAKKLNTSGLKEQTQLLLKLLEINPLQEQPPYKKLAGDLHGAISRRINIQHRLVYQILEDEKIIKVLRMWSHYE